MPSPIRRIKPIKPKRGDIVRVKLDPTVGSEQAGERPALVVSADFINERAPVILVASTTSRKTDRVYPFEALIEADEAGLTIRSKVSLIQLRGIDKQRVVGMLGAVSDTTMERIEDALRIATGLANV